MLRILALMLVVIELGAIWGAAPPEAPQAPEAPVSPGAVVGHAGVQVGAITPGDPALKPSTPLGPGPSTPLGPGGSASSGDGTLQGTASLASGANKFPGPQIGFAINFHHTDDVTPYLQAIDQLAAMGVTSVQLVTPAFQENGAGEEISIDIGPGLSPKPQDIVAILKRAHERGLSTALMPIVLFRAPRGNEWRGKIHPENWDAWWLSYRKFEDHFLTLAREANVDAYAVGSELLSTEKETTRWEALIAHARQRFGGKLYYSTNWDHYHVPTFWARLDMIGISCYWDVTTETDPDKPQLAGVTKRWTEIRKQVLEFAQAQHRPILLTEVGYPCLPWGLKDPWNYVNTTSAKATPEIQALGYEAFLAAWERDLAPVTTIPAPGEAAPIPSPPMAGVYFYSWEPWSHGGDGDTGYGVQGKPAAEVLRKWLAERGKSASVSPPQAQGQAANGAHP